MDQFQAATIHELDGLVLIGAASHSIAARAKLIVESCNDTFNEESSMSVTDAADLAISMVRG